MAFTLGRMPIEVAKVRNKVRMMCSHPLRLVEATHLCSQAPADTNSNVLSGGSTNDETSQSPPPLFGTKHTSQQVISHSMVLQKQAYIVNSLKTLTPETLLEISSTETLGSPEGFVWRHLYIWEHVSVVS